MGKGFEAERLPRRTVDYRKFQSHVAGLRTVVTRLRQGLKAEKGYKLIMFACIACRNHRLGVHDTA